MWSATIGYRRYLEPYLPRFFADAAGKLALAGREALIDLACGTGEIAFGFSKYVGSLTGVDLEPAMIQGAEAAAKERGVKIRLIHSAVEELPDDLGQFDLVTIGKAHFWLKAEATIDRLDRILAKGGRIFICFAGTVRDGDSAWYRAYRQVRRRWAPDYPFHRLAEAPEEFLQDSPFRRVSAVRVVATHTISVDHLVNRAFAYEANSRVAIGDRQEQFIAELRAALAPYARDGAVKEKFQNRGVIFERSA